MQVSLNPGEVYAYVDPRTPDLCKVGKACTLSRRMSSHQTACVELLDCTVRLAFLDCVWAESELKLRLRDDGRHVRGEHFRVTAEEVRLILDELRRIERPHFEQLLSSVNFLQAAGYANDAAKQAESNASPIASPALPPALELLLSTTVTRFNMKVRVDTLIQAGLAGTDISDCERRLARVGIILSPGCRCVIFDKSEGSRLDSFFRKTVSALSWRTQLSSVAALDANLAPISCEQFEQSAMASPHLKEVSCRV